MQVDLTADPVPAAPLSCSKCGETGLAGPDFHSHILVCGGLKLWDSSPSKKKRRKGGHGGGLKSTVRMIQKSGQARDGTDTGITDSYWQLSQSVAYVECQNIKKKCENSRFI